MTNGNNATVEFYLDDAPILSAFVFQSMFDVGQFELLRGPQGTLRGRASPSGSITLTTRRPNLSEPGVVANLSYSNTRAFKGDFALNVPIIQDVLGIRVAGVYSDDEGNRVHSIRRSTIPGTSRIRTPRRRAFGRARRSSPPMPPRSSSCTRASTPGTWGTPKSPRHLLYRTCPPAPKWSRWSSPVRSPRDR